MRREFHVRFCEGAGVQFPRATRLVMMFELEDDARRVLAVLSKRLGRFGLTLHPDKTRLLDFRRPRSGAAGPPQHGRSFDFLGFTHHWARGRQGRWVVRRKTAKSRFKRAVVAIAQWCRRHRHMPVGVQRALLARKLQGHYAYYGLSGNYRAVARSREAVAVTWRKWLARRSQRGMPWDRFKRHLRRHPLPEARIVHSFV